MESLRFLEAFLKVWWAQRWRKLTEGQAVDIIVTSYGRYYGSKNPYGKETR